MSEQEPQEQVAEGTPKRNKRDENRMIAAAIAGALLIAFALLNTEKVKVDWIVGSTHSRLIIVIVVAAALGALADRLLVIRARRKKG